MTITYLDPKAGPTAVLEPYETSISAEPNSPIVVGLLANGFPDSVPFMHAVGVALLTRLPAGSTTSFLNKGNASMPATHEQVDTLAQNANVVVAAYGH
jgi:hypothetical protein